MNVLVYASSASPGLSNALRSILSPFYTVQSIIPASLATQPWTASCALLVLTPPDTSPAPLSLSRPAQEAIQEYVDAGGRVLGIGLGVSFLSHRPARDRFDLWDATSGTAIVPESPQVVPALLPLSSILLRTGSLLSSLRPASVPFELTRASSDNEAILGRWEDVGAIAGIQVPIGSGRAAFWGVSPYIDGTEDTASVHALLQYALKSLGLSVPPETIPGDSPDPLQVPTIPGHPLPQFLLCPRGRRHIAETVLRRLGLSAGADASSVSEVRVIKDKEDVFHFHWAATLEHGARLVAEARAFADATSHAAMTPGAPQVVIVLPPDVLPTAELTPRFNAEKYFAVLGEARGNRVRAADDSWGVGEALFYGEAVTSTQTMLERNPRFLTSLPTPIVSLATFQLTGRGRGSNVWLSPPGCLQFSVLVRAQRSAFPAPRLVLVQYLVGLAVVNACRDARALGPERGARVRLKWPNDVYIDLPSSSTLAGSTKKKVGGILVNASFSDGNVDIVVGCGINVCTPAPVPALSLLSGNAEGLEPETVLALVLTEFERLWGAFIAGQGAWAPFDEAYLDAWMHSDQLVMLTTVEPHVPVRIVGITHDHGLLRTIPERVGWGRSAQYGTDDEYIDLQPDGNSFDIMSRLIKAKK